MNLARKQKRLWKMKATVIPIVLGAVGTARKGTKKRLEEVEIRRRIDTIQTIVLFKSARILENVQERLAVTQTSEINYQLKLV